MRVVVFGLWHLGCVTAACLAGAGHDVVGLDLDQPLVEELRRGVPPLHEPGLDELIAAGLESGRLAFSGEPTTALTGADVVWIAFDTPVDEDDHADVAFVRDRIDAIAPSLPAGALVLVSSQVPVGFTRALAGDLVPRGVRTGYSPENLRLGKAIEVFRAPERVIMGLQDEADRPHAAELFAPFTDNLEFMTLESAEMTKHALNSFLATCVTFANEVARICEQVGADAKEVERGLKSEGRIGRKAYLAPGGAFAGGTLARDVHFLQDFGRASHVATPLLDGVLESNDEHKNWPRRRLEEVLDRHPEAVVAVLGLTYKPGTSTLRRSRAVELCRWLGARGVPVRAFDPEVREIPADEMPTTTLCTDARSALAGATVAVVATEWPQFRELGADDFAREMSTPRVVDEGWFLAGALGQDPRVAYVATGSAPDHWNPQGEST